MIEGGLMVDTDPVRIELSAGGVIHRAGPGDDGLQILVIKDAYGNWGFPKGHLEEGETPRDAALRECSEETGLNHLEPIKWVGMTDWYFRDGGVVVHKYCDYFLLRAQPGDEARPQRGEGIRACHWLSPLDATARVTYHNAQHVLKRALERMGGEPAVAS